MFCLILQILIIDEYETSHILVRYYIITNSKIIFHGSHNGFHISRAGWNNNLHISISRLGFSYNMRSRRKHLFGWRVIIIDNSLNMCDLGLLTYYSNFTICTSFDATHGAIDKSTTEACNFYNWFYTCNLLVGDFFVRFNVTISFTSIAQYL